MSKKVVFLMSDTGGGHRASANALVEALTALYGDAVQCELVDVFARYAEWPLNRAPDFYQPVVDGYPWLWRLIWRLAEHPVSAEITMRAVNIWQTRALHRLANDLPADLYVSVHPLLNRLPQQALRRRYPHSHFATVITDLSSAPHYWYDPDVDLLSTSCEEVQREALRMGVSPARAHLFGLPIRLAFSAKLPTRRQARRVLELEERPTVLLQGGGAGIGDLEEIAHALAPVLTARGGQLAVICGRNENLHQRMAAQSWPMPTRIAGFVDNMPVWMAASDILITKAGPGTIAEGLACGLPIILSSFVPGQEEGNVSFVEQNQVGVYRPNPQRIAATVNSWLDPKNATLPDMRHRAQTLAKPQAALDIARALSKFL